MNITENLIKTYTDESVFTRGVELYKFGKVIEMNVEEENSLFYNFKIYKIDGFVTSTDYDEYNSVVTFNDRSGFMNVKCDCQNSSQAFRSKGFCKHVVALLLKYIDENRKKNSRAIGQDKLDRLFRELKGSMIKSSNYKREVKLQIIYCYEKNDEIPSSLEFKIGTERLYIVKNMKNFLKSIESGEIIEFGKNFTFNSREHKFSEEDKRIIELLLENLEVDSKTLSERTTLYYGARLFSGKKAYITDKQLGRVFSFLKDRYISCNIQGVEYDEVKVLEEDIPLDFHIKEEKNKIFLMHDTDMPRPLSSNGRYYFYKENIYIPSSEQLKLYIPFYNAFLRERSYTLSFRKEDGDKLASYVLPSLKRISKNVDIDKSLQESFYEDTLNVKVYLDKDVLGASAAVKYSYGEIEIDALKEEPIKNQKGLLIRDIEGELGINTLLESFGFGRENDRYILVQEDKIVAFLKEGVNRLQEIAEVYYSESFKDIKVYGSGSYKSSIKLNEEDLLEFSFSIEGVERSELKDIIRALREKKKYYKLKKGGFVSLEEKEIKAMVDMIEYLDIKDADFLKDSILLKKYDALYLDKNIRDNDLVYIERNKAFKDMVNNIKEAKDMDYTLPEHLETIMRGYQKTGFRWFKTLASYGFGGILADEMGLGKTLQTIAFIDSEKGNGPSIVIAPTSLVYNWKSEIEKFSPDLKTLVISGNKGEREELIKAINESDIVITSYPLIRRDIEEYRDINFRYCILDEAQHIKNPSSMNASSVKEIKAKGYFALTGTPIENSLTELWSIFDFIMPGYLLSHNKFMQKYEMPISKDKNEKALKQLNNHIKPFILRRLKKDVIKELPDKIEHKLVVEMTEEQKKLYVAYLNSAKNEVDEEIEAKGLSKSRIKILSVLTRLRQICCDPSVFIEGFSKDSGKMIALDDILQETISEGHRILLFSQFTSVLKNIATRLKEQDIDYMYLDGSVKTEERGRMVKEFNEGQGSVFLISLKAGGTGLNLTGADVVIHFDPWWNPAVEDQATDRAHRIGQKKTVEVIKLIAQGSIEEKIYKLQEKKKEIIDNVMGEGMNENNILTHMTKEEIEDLFSL